MNPTSRSHDVHETCGELFCGAIVRRMCQRSLARSAEQELTIEWRYAVSKRGFHEAGRLLGGGKSFGSSAYAEDTWQLASPLSCLWLLLPRGDRPSTSLPATFPFLTPPPTRRSTRHGARDVRAPRHSGDVEQGVLTSLLTADVRTKSQKCDHSVRAVVRADFKNSNFI